VIVWGDQSGVSLLPQHVRTWARPGQTPVLRVALTRDQRAAIAAIAAITAITADQRLVMQTQTTADHRTEVVRFLRLLLRTIAGKLLIISRWRADPWRPVNQGLLGPWGRQAPPSGATAWLCPGAHSSGRDLE
jgi:hypothetical protein